MVFLCVPLQSKKRMSLLTVGSSRTTPYYVVGTRVVFSPFHNLYTRIYICISYFDHVKPPLNDSYYAGDFKKPRYLYSW